METQDTLNNYVREVVINYRGPKRKSPRFSSPQVIVDFLRKTMVDNSREQFITLYLGHTNQVIAYDSTIGSQGSCQVVAREIFQRALLVGANSIVVAHNHPSGELTPSQEDKNVTTRIHEMGKMLQVPLLDHLIITDDNYLSFRETNTVPGLYF
jgi:DNA repair protein RadC